MTKQQPTTGPSPEVPHTAKPSATFDYQVAFVRNLGLVSVDEQQRLRKARVAVAGVGGVGGLHAVTLARMGIGRFRLIDPDVFELANFNRQVGATMDTIGRSKVDVAASQVASINPEAEIEATHGELNADNVDDFVRGADMVVDGLDFFCIDVRSALFAAARRHKVPVVTSGPIGMSATMLLFTPEGMPFEHYFDVRPEMPKLDRLVAFLVGLTPRMTQLPYMETARADLKREFGPSVAAACMLCAGVVGVETLRVVLGRPGLRPAPYYYQFDAYRHQLCRGRLHWGNRGPVQRLKRALVKRKLIREIGPG